MPNTAKIEAVRRLHSAIELDADDDTDDRLLLAARMIEEIGPDAADLADDHKIIERQLMSKRVSQSQARDTSQIVMRR